MRIVPIKKVRIRMKKLSILIVLSMLLMGCTSNSNNDNPDGLSIVTTSFVTYDFARAIAKEDNVNLLIKPGQDTHSFEPTTQDMIDIENADLLIYTNDGLEPWVNGLLDESILKLDASKSITYLESDHDHDHDEEDHDHESNDPHTWTSMKNAVIMVETIRDSLIELKPENKDTYTENAQALITELQQLDQDYATVFEAATVEPLVFLGHFGLNYLLHDYGVAYLALFESMSHETEPTVAQMRLIIDTIEDHDLKYVFVEELAQIKLVQTIEAETGVETLELHSTHNITQQQLDDGVTFVEIQKQNVENLKVGLK